MKKNAVYLILQTVVCCALAAFLAASAISIYRDGQALRAIDPKAEIYSPQIISERLAPIVPLFFASLGLLIAGLALGIRDENAEKPGKSAALGRRSALRETEAARPRMREERAEGLAPAAMPAVPPKRRRGAQAALLVAAAALIVAGILNGSARDVLYKAITICSECVGLG